MLKINKNKKTEEKKKMGDMRSLLRSMVLEVSQHKKACWEMAKDVYCTGSEKRRDSLSKC